jgi:hypothetical protein
MKNDFIKKPNEQQEFSAEQIQELVKCSKDPIYFIRKYIKIQHPTKGSIPFDLYPYQERAIRAFEANRFTAVLASRQSGKSIVIAAYLLWFSVFKFDKTVLVASNKNTNAMEIMHRIRYAYEELPFWLKPGCEYYTKHSIEFDNGSKIFSQATTENTGRGMSCVSGNTEITIKNKTTGKIDKVKIGDFYANISSSIINSDMDNIGDKNELRSFWNGNEISKVVQIID